MIFLFAYLTHSLCQTINRTLYLLEGEMYKQSLPELFSDRIDYQYSFVGESKGFQMDQSNLKQLPMVGKYIQNPNNIICQKQYKNLNDHQGNNQYGILQEYETDKFQICYNDNIQKLDMDFCIRLDDGQEGFDFVFLSFNRIAVSSIRNDQFIVTIYLGNTQEIQYFFEPTLIDQEVKSTIINQMINYGNKYLLVAGIYQSLKINIPIDVLKINQDGSIIKTQFFINLIDFIEQDLLFKISEMKGSYNGTVFIQVSTDTSILIYQLQILRNIWQLQFKYDESKQIGFELGYSKIQRNYSESILLVQETKYYIQSTSFINKFQNYYQLQISRSVIFKFTSNYLILLQDNTLIINNFQNNIQKIHDLQLEILYIDVDFLNDILIVFTSVDIRKYQLQDIYLTYYYQKSQANSTQTVIVQNGEQMAAINYKIIDKNDNNLYQISTPVNEIYYNYFYSEGPYKIPLQVSGFNPELIVLTDRQLQINTTRQFTQMSEQYYEASIFSSLITSNYDHAMIFKQYSNFSFAIYGCFQNKILDCTYKIMSLNVKYKQIVKLHKLQQADHLGYLIQVDNILDVYSQQDYCLSTIQGIQIINDVVVTDKIFVVYQTFIKVYTYPQGIEISIIDSQSTGIKDPIKIITNSIFNNYVFILSQTGQLVIGQYTNQFYLTQSIQLDTINVDVSIITEDRIIISKKINNNYDVSLYQIRNGQIFKQNELDLHNYTINDYILQKDYWNGKVGIQAQLNNQCVILMYGYTKLQRDQLQQVIILEQDFEFLSMGSQDDQTQILFQHKSNLNQSMMLVYYDYQFMYVKAQDEYQTDLFSQLLPLTYQYSNNFNQVSIQKQIAYEYNFYKIKGKMINVIQYKGDEEQIVTELPQDLTGQVTKMQILSSSYNIKLITRIKNKQYIDSYGFSVKCQEVDKFERIICINQLQITYHSNGGELVQKLNFNQTINELILNRDNTNAILRSSQEIMLLNITQGILTLYPNTIKKNMYFSRLLFYKSWLINYSNYVLEYYLVITDNIFDIQIQKNIEISQLNEVDYYPGTQSIYYTQKYQSSIVEDYLNKNMIYVVDLELDYLKVIENTLMISSNFGHLYTFNLEKLQLINLYIISFQYHISDIKVQDQYIYLQSPNILYKNTGKWNKDKPYLSLETLRGQQCIALFKQNDQINILYLDYYDRVANSIIDDRIILQISNLSETIPTNSQIYAFNGIQIKTVKIDDKGS